MVLNTTRLKPAAGRLVKIWQCRKEELPNWSFSDFILCVKEQTNDFNLHLLSKLPK